MNILMTGSDGYIGSHLKPALEKEGYTVFEFDGDISEFKIASLIYIDMVIHLAGRAGVRESFDKPEEYYKVNVEGSKAVFKACHITDVPVIYTSSSNAAEWWTNPYATTKKIMEEIAPKNSLGVRPHTVYPGREDMLYWKLNNDIESIKYINTRHYRDFTHIEDFCSALCTLVANYDIIEPRVVDIGTGHAVRVMSVAKKFGWKGEGRIDPTPKEREVTIADVTVLKKLGWINKHYII